MTTTTTPTTPTVDDLAARLGAGRLLDLLAAHVSSRPGIDPRDFACNNDYQREAHAVSMQATVAHVLIRWARSLNATPSEILQASRRAYSGRCSFEVAPDGATLYVSHCAGQCHWAEYRAAVCSVLASLIWRRLADDGARVARLAKGKEGVGETIRRVLRAEAIERGMRPIDARRWFD